MSAEVSFASISAPETEQERDPPPPPLEILKNPAWLDRRWLIHGFSTRAGGVSRFARASRPEGDLNLGYTAQDTEDAVRTNRSRFLQALKPEHLPNGHNWGLVTLKQMHSSLVRRVGRMEAGERASLWGDGLITDQPGVMLGIQTADCLPILVADMKRRAVGAFHAGWRGTLKGIVQGGLVSMVREFSCEPTDMRAVIGPGIGQCCFAVGVEVRDLFAAKYPECGDLFSSGEQLTLNLAEANRRQLLAAGLKPEAIFHLDACTSCKPDTFFSYRAERGSTGRLMALIGIKPG